MGYHIGIDAGSKTIKVVITDDDGTLIHSLYRRHRSDIKTTLAEALHDLVWRHGDIQGSIGITGSAGIGLAEALHLPFIQEVVATTLAVQTAYPQADAIIELGGEDAKIVYLTDGLEQRMNATCAGGTGGFIDTIAFMLGSSSKNISSLALGANRIYPIASRCAVFAQTDVRPLLNAGAKTSDIAASTLEAVVRQTLGGLACGRPIQGTVIFLGGPLEHIPDLVRRFRTALNITHREGIKPPNAHLFTAQGAALAATDNPSVVSLTALEKKLAQVPTLVDDLTHLPPLFTSNEEYALFKHKHEQNRMPRTRLFDCHGSLYLGIDAGSTTVKLALLDENDRLAYSDYRPTKGDPLKTTSEMLLDLYTALPRTTQGVPSVTIAHTTATGYGEDLLRAGLGIDTGVVETIAHMRAAQHFQPHVTFLLDIGGQDMKAIWVHNGRIVNAVLNEACSSGCGSFIEGTAYSLRSTPYRFSSQALFAPSPVDLGTKCTVFMTSRVRHAQKIGISIEDIAAGIAYSVVKNALFRIIGMNKLDSLGSHVVVQGGAFMSDAVLRAFELISGREAIRPDTAHLMGALGAALTAHKRAQAGSLQADTPPAQSSLISAEKIADLNPRYLAIRCPGCTNTCALSIVEFDENRQFISGNRCDRAHVFVKRYQQKIRSSIYYKQNHFADTATSPADRQRISAPTEATKPCSSTSEIPAPEQGSSPLSMARRTLSKPKATAQKRVPNVVALEQKLLNRFTDVCSTACRKTICIGIINTLTVYEQLPFWHTFFSGLGFSIRIPNDKRAEESGATREGLGTIASESVCYPAKLTHSRLYDLIRADATVIFMPRYHNDNHCPVSCGYASALADSVPLLRKQPCRMMSPLFETLRPQALCASENDRTALLASINDVVTKSALPPLCKDEFDAALDAALNAYQAFLATLRNGNRQALAWMKKTSRRGIVLAGRPYHNDPALLHSIDRVIADLVLAVLSPLELASVAPHQPAKTKPTSSWRPGKHLINIARLVEANPTMELVCLQSFGCGYDTVSLMQVRAFLEKANRPYTALKIDDITDTAHIRIRLRTLAETLEAQIWDQQARQAGISLTADIDIYSNKKDTLPNGEKDGHEDKASHQEFLLEQTTIDQHASMPSHTTLRPSDHTRPTPLLGRIEQADIEVARQGVDNNICFVVSALAGRAIRLMQADPTITSLSIPSVCQGCLLEALPDIVAQSTGRNPHICWTNVGYPALPSQTDCTVQKQVAPSSCQHTEKVKAPLSTNNEPDTSPRIGIMGCPLLCFDSFMNNDIVSFIQAHGGIPALPEPAHLFTHDVRYIPQLDTFAKQGANHVIYLQSFGCLKGHIQARGALHYLAKRYPTLPVTVIDYDPEASALNRENRILLALAAAKEAMKETDSPL